MKNIINKIASALAGVVLFSTFTISLAGCAGQSQSKTDMQSSRIIELTSTFYDETIIYINTDYIIKIVPSIYYEDIEFTKMGIGSTIYLNGDNMSISVKETPEEILKLVKDH